jgi:hypothetical protein
VSKPASYARGGSKSAPREPNDPSPEPAPACRGRALRAVSPSPSRPLCLPHRLPHRLSHCVSHCLSHCCLQLCLPLYLPHRGRGELVPPPTRAGFKQRERSLVERQAHPPPHPAPYLPPPPPHAWTAPHPSAEEQLEAHPLRRSRTSPSTLTSHLAAAAEATPAEVQRCKSWRNREGFRVGDRSRGRYATPAGTPRRDGTPYRGLRARRWGLGCVHRSRAAFCRAVPNLSV